MKYVGHICNKCLYKIYSGLHLPDEINFEYNNRVFRFRPNLANSIF